jgi:hypothetical protein
VFRAAADVDDTTWARGRGWALCLGLGAEHYYRVKNPPLVAVGRRMMLQALADHQRTGWWPPCGTLWHPGASTAPRPTTGGD